jgi:hypothetical protein
MHVAVASVPVFDTHSVRTKVVTVAAVSTPIWATPVTATAEAEINSDTGIGVGGADGGGAGGDCERCNRSQKDFLKHSISP